MHCAQFTVHASDQQGIFEKSSNATVSISVTRTQSIPAFTGGAPYQATVSENAPVNSTVFTVTAASSNPSSQLRYALTGVAPFSDSFGINPSTGGIYVTRALFEDTNTAYVLLVSAWDVSNPGVTVSTSVTLMASRNEYAPVFYPSSYQASVHEYDPVGTNVTRVYATDENPAGTPGSIVAFTIAASSPGSAYFFMNPSSGDIMVILMLAYDLTKAPTYQV